MRSLFLGQACYFGVLHCSSSCAPCFGRSITDQTLPILPEKKLPKQSDLEVATALPHDSSVHQQPRQQRFMRPRDGTNRFILATTREKVDAVALRRSNQALFLTESRRGAVERCFPTIPRLKAYYPLHYRDTTSTAFLLFRGEKEDALSLPVPVEYTFSRTNEKKKVPSWVSREIKFEELPPSDVAALYHYHCSLCRLDPHLTAAPTTTIELREWLRRTRDNIQCVSHLSLRQKSVTQSYVFTLYTENISTNAALIVLSSRFSVQRKHFSAIRKTSKLGCFSNLCFAQSITKEELLSVNTMRWHGFVLRVCAISTAQQDDWVSFKKALRAGDITVLHKTTFAMRRVCGSHNDVDQRMATIAHGGSVNYVLGTDEGKAQVVAAVCRGEFQSAFFLCFSYSIPSIAAFIKAPSRETAKQVLDASPSAEIRRLIKTYLSANGDYVSMLKHRSSNIGVRACHFLHNLLISKRLREGGMQVVPGDLVVRKDVERWKLEYVWDELDVVSSEEQALNYEIFDVVLPVPDPFMKESRCSPRGVGSFETIRSVASEYGCEGILDGYSLYSDVREMLGIKLKDFPQVYRRIVLRPLSLRYKIFLDTLSASQSVPADALRLIPNGRVMGIYGDQRNAFDALVEEDVARNFDDEKANSDFFVPGKELRKATFAVQKPATPQSSLDSLVKVKTVVVEMLSISAHHSYIREGFSLGNADSRESSNLQHVIHGLGRASDPDSAFDNDPSYCWLCNGVDHTSETMCVLQKERKKYITKYRQTLQVQSFATTEPDIDLL